jgi:hypothetical protein
LLVDTLLANETNEIKLIDGNALDADASSKVASEILYLIKSTWYEIGWER